MSAEPEDLRVLYANRFGSEGPQRADLWAVLCRDFFQRWVPRDATVLDVARATASSSTTSRPDAGSLWT